MVVVKTRGSKLVIMSSKKVPYKALKPNWISDKAWTEIIIAWENGLSDREASFRASRDGDVFITEAELKEIVASDSRIADIRDFLHTEIVAQAKLNIAESLREGSVATSKWYLERKAPDEFSSKASVAFEGAVVGLTMEEKQKELDQLLSDFGGVVEDKTEDKTDGEGSV